jgi:hypothetical protein
LVEEEEGVHKPLKVVKETRHSDLNTGRKKALPWCATVLPTF